MFWKNNNKIATNEDLSKSAAMKERDPLAYAKSVVFLFDEWKERREAAMVEAARRARWFPRICHISVGYSPHEESQYWDALTLEEFQRIAKQEMEFHPESTWRRIDDVPNDEFVDEVFRCRRYINEMSPKVKI